METTIETGAPRTGRSGGRRTALRRGLIAALVATALAAPRAVAATSGVPDLFFGAQGAVFTDATTNLGRPVFARYAALAVQPDGRIVAAGTVRWMASDGPEMRMYVARYMPDGKLDPSFGGGLVMVDFPGSNEERAAGLALLPGGDMVVAGTWLGDPSTAADDTIALARLVGSGASAATLDPTFGQRGLALQPRVSGIGGISASSIALVGGGDRLLVAGSSSGGFAITAAYDVQGQPLDRGTRLPGNLTFTSPPDRIAPRINALRPYLDGAFGATSTPDGLAMLAIRSDAFTADLDGPFAQRPAAGGPVRWATHLAGATQAIGDGIARDFVDDVWYVVGSVVIGGERRVAIAAFTANGPDTRFSGDGIVSFDLAPGDETLTAAYVEQDGSVVAVGHAGDRMLMVRVLPSGDVDRRFGGDGVVLDQVPGAAASAIEAITGAQAAGRFVVAGGATQASDGVKRLLVAQFGPPLGAISCTRLLGCATLTPVAAGAPLTPLSPQRPTGVIVQPEVAVCQPAKVGGGGCVPCRTGSGCTSVGILVKRVVHGRAEYAGRVPFGPQRAGRRALRWNLKLGGRRVPHGTYVIRIRALRRGKVVEVSKPFRLRL